MKLTFLGTGSAEDPGRVNTAYFIEHGDRSILVDCGFTVYPALCKAIGGLSNLGTHPSLILLTHCHGDHRGSLSQLLLGIWRACKERGQGRELLITGEPGAIKAAESALDHDFPGLRWGIFEQTKLRISFQPIVQSYEFSGIKIEHAPTNHSVPSIGFKFSVPGASIGISGDGALTPESEKLFSDVDLLSHEAFSMDTRIAGHASLKEVVEYATKSRIKRVAAVHIDYSERTKEKEIKSYISHAREQGVTLFVPNDGDSCLVE